MNNSYDPNSSDAQQNEPLTQSAVDPVASQSEIDQDSGVKRGLKTRHLSMLALAGIIGPGLLIGTGGALADGGPASLLIGFGVIGIVAFSVMQSLGELTTLYPSGGAFTKLADRFVDPAFGVAVGWNYFIIWFCVLSNEYNSVTSILAWWSDKVPVWGYFLLLWLLGVESFGEAEYWLAIIKLAGLAAYYLFSIVYVSGGIPGNPAFGFLYWYDPGPWVDGARGAFTVFVFCATFYAGVESVAVAAAETKKPGEAIPLAIRQVFWRIIFVYMGAAFFYGITCPADAEQLTSGGALQSPMTVAVQQAGWEAGINLINAFILVTCISAVNSSIYIASRTLLFMGQDGKAPKIFGWTDKRGVPVPAVLFANACGALSMMNVSTGAAAAYGYIVGLSGVATFLVWGSISFIHIRFRSAWAAQGYSTEDLPFVSLWYPWNAYFGVAANILLALIQGWTTLSPFNAGKFVDAYILLPVFFLIYFGYKIAFKTTFWRANEIDLQSGRRNDLVDPKPDVSPAALESNSESDGAKPKMTWKQTAQTFWKNF